MTARLSLSMTSGVEDLGEVAAAVEAFAQAQGWPPNLEYQIMLVVEELGINILDYGYEAGERQRKAEIEIVSDARAITIRTVDDGRPFDPLNDAPSADTESPLGDRPIGGLGVHLVKTMMDEAHYRREGNRNCLPLVKRRTGAGEEAG